MKTRFILSVAAITLAIGALAPVSATKSTPPSGPQPMTQPTTALHPFPEPAAGMKQFVIHLPRMADEQAARVGLIAGRMQETDGVNFVRLSGQLTEKTLQGWGYTYFEVEGASGSSMTTRIGVRPGTPKVTKFVGMPEMLVRYNSRLPIVIYAPENFELRYRIYQAGPEQSAELIAVGPASGQALGINPSGPSITGPAVTDPSMTSPALPAGELYLDAGSAESLPAGAMATISLYDSRLMDTDSTYGKIIVPVSHLPVQIPLPDAHPDRPVAGPAVSVVIRGVNGQPLYLNDTVTPLAQGGPTHVALKRFR